MSDKELEGSDQDPDVSDEALWAELNRQLRVLVSEIRVSVNHSPTGVMDVETSISPADMWKKNCLSLPRCSDISEAPSSLTNSEQLHLDGCRYCERQIASFARLKRQPYDVTPSPEMVSEETGSVWIVEQLRAIASAIESGAWLRPRQSKIVLAMLALILVVGAGLFLLVDFKLRRNDRTVSAPAVNPSNQNQSLARNVDPNSGNSNSTATSPNDANLETPPKPLDKSGTNDRTPARPTASSAARAKLPIDESDLQALSKVDREAVLESSRTGEIWLPDSDLMMLNDTTRGTSSEVTAISPKNEATFNTNPNFVWSGPPNQEYQIIVTYRGGEFVTESDFLSRTHGHVRDRLKPGIYFWRLETRGQGENERIVTELNIFKILSLKEKEQIRAAVAPSGSNLVRAILFARAGYTKEAESELSLELHKHPNSAIAKRMLTQVRGWRKK